MFFALLRQKVLFRNLQFFLIGIAGQFDYFHTIKQRPRNSGSVISRRYKENMGQVKRDLQKMIPESGILLRVQHFKQGCCRVTPIVGSEFVNFIEHNKRIARPCLYNGTDNPAGHGTDIGLPMSPDIRLIVHTAERNPHQLTVRSFGDTHGNARFSRSGCS